MIQVSGFTLTSFDHQAPSLTSYKQHWEKKRGSVTFLVMRNAPLLARISGQPYSFYFFL